MMDNILYSWSFNSNKNRGKLWYIISFSISIGLIIWGFLSKQYGMSLFIIMLISFIFYLENNTDDIIDVIINSRGIKVADSFYAFSDIKSFSIIYDGDNAIILRLKFIKKMGETNIDIAIDDNIINDIRAILVNFLEEEKNEKLTFFEKIIRILKI